MPGSDAELLERCAAGDQAAWTQLVDRYAGLVHSIPRRLGLPRELCEDVTQLVFAEFARQIQRIRREDSLAGWFGAVARRESWRARRRQARRSAGESPLEVDVAAEADPPEHAERMFAVRSAVAALDPRCRALVELLFFSDPEPSYSEVSQRLGIAVGSVGPTRRRCLAKLIAVLGPFSV